MAVEHVTTNRILSPVRNIITSDIVIALKFKPKIYGYDDYISNPSLNIITYYVNW